MSREDSEMKKRGRPRRTNEASKVQMRFYCSPSEAELIRKAAKVNRQRSGKFIRDLALDAAADLVD